MTRSGGGSGGGGRGAILRAPGIGAAAAGGEVPIGAGTAVRWTARVWSLLSAGLLLAFAFGGGEPFHPTAEEAVGLLLFPGGVLLGFAVAWRREAVGGWLTVGSLVLFHLWMFSRSGKWPPGPWFLLFAAPGPLFLLSARLRRGVSPRAPPGPP